MTVIERDEYRLNILKKLCEATGGNIRIGVPQMEVVSRILRKLVCRSWYK